MTSRPVSLRGAALLNDPLLNKGRAFSEAERRQLGLSGLLPPGVLTLEQQVELELERLAAKSDDLERYIGLAAIQDRNETLFHRLLVENLDALLPTVYTPTVGLACKQYSRARRRPRGLWITPDDVARIPELLHNAGRPGVRLIVATDNERVLGLGDQGAGGMGIAVGKLALYSAGAGVHPELVLPVSLDVGTDNVELLEDPFYLGWRHPRLRGGSYFEVVDAFVDAVAEVFPHAVVQWEDLKHHTAIEVLERYRRRLPSFNDDIQGTAAVTVAGILAALRVTGEPLTQQRVVLLGAGAAGTGIARLLGLALRTAGAGRDQAGRAVLLLDSRGLLYEGRSRLHPDQKPFACSAATLSMFGLDGGGPHDLETVVRHVRPTVLVGTSGTPGSFTEGALREMARHVARPIVLALSNPTSHAEATPEQIFAWAGDGALVATGSPFDAVGVSGRRRVVGQANNAFVFPGVGLGLIASQARAVTWEMFLEAARVLAASVDGERLAAGALYPPLSQLRRVSREVAIRIAAINKPASANGQDPASAVDELIWWPAYAAYVPST